MKNASRVLSALLLMASAACTTTLTPGGAKVDVYETNHPSSEGLAKLPAGCRLLGAQGPIDQQASERLVEDPYRAERNWTAEKGGNVLLLRSAVLRSLPKTECPPNDTSYDCQETLQTWYRVGFEAFACDEPARQALVREANERAPDKIAWWWPFGSKKKASTTSPAAAPAAPATSAAPPAAAASAPTAPAAQAPPTKSLGLSNAELKAKILDLMKENVSVDVIVAYVKSRRVASPLSADEIIDWKRAGIAEPVIETAIAQASR
jgi:hypothetical protein